MLIATALTVPVVAVIALALAPRGSSSNNAGGQAVATSVVSVAAATPSPAAVEPCAQVESALPVQLDGLNPRTVHPFPNDSAAVVAWGDPPIVFQCGVARPAGFTASVQLIAADGVNWLAVGTSKVTVFTAVDRVVYIQLTVPKSYAQPPLASVADAIAKTLPAICHTGDDVATTAADGSTVAPVGPLCVNR